MHSNNREMKAVIKAVNSFQNQLSNSNLLILTDNSSTVAVINKQGGTKSWSLTQVAWELWSILDTLNCQVKA